MGVSLPVSIPKMPAIEEWEDTVLLEMEKEALGFYITGHPMDKFRDIIRKYASVNTQTLQDAANEKMVRIGGALKVSKLHKTKKGEMMAFCNIEDQYASVEVVVFPKVYTQTHTFLAQEQIVLLEAEVQKTDNAVKLLAEKIVPIEQAENEWTSGVVLHADAAAHGLEILEQVKPIIERWPGECLSFFKIKVDDAHPEVLVKLSDEYRTQSHPDFFKEVETILGEGSIETRCAPVKEKVQKKKRWARQTS